MIILTRDDQVLLAQHQGTGYADGQWNLPSGKVEPGEPAEAAIIREAREEIGVRLDPTRLVPVGAVHYLNPEGQTRLGLFYAIRSDPATQGKLASLPPAWWGGEGSCMGECPTNQGGRSLPAPPGQ
jgi:8-oxo-dGTP pyrophosphatase MutT (NUDIX family)